MLNKLRRQKIIVVGLMFGLSSLTGLISPFVSSASAVSAYDETLKTVSSLSLAADWSGWLECSAEDISTTWHKYMTDESTLYSTGGSNIEDFEANKTSFENALDHGVWGVTKGAVASGGDYIQFIDIWWKENSSITLDWSIANGAHKVVKIDGDGLRTQTVQQRANYGTSGGDPCDLVVKPTTSTESSLEVSNEFGDNLTASAPRTPRAVYFANISENSINYPYDYEGVSVPYFYQGATISGNVQCANTNNVISHVIIDTQSSIDGDALLTDDGVGGKNYRFFLWDSSPYSLVVVCDGDSFYGPTVDTNLYYYYNWACAPTSPGQNPNLRVCAAA